MNFVERFIDKAIEASKPIVALAEGLRLCSVNLQQLAINVGELAKQQHVHHQMIGQMWCAHQLIFKKMSESSIDVSMPKISAEGSKPEKKSN